MGIVFLHSMEFMWGNISCIYTLETKSDLY
jgi:hypothetical protein